MSNPALIEMLAASLLAGEATPEQVFARASHTLGREWPWLRTLAQRFVKAIAGRTRTRHRDAVNFLRRDRGFQYACSKHRDELAVKHWRLEPPQMQPAAAAAGWNVPPIVTVGALAEWLRVPISELEWFADLKALDYKQHVPRLSHYHYRILSKKSGTIRLIEAPKTRLKELQRQILSGILEKIPSHAAVHGFVKARSVKTFAAPHAGKRVVLRMDLKDFFPSFSGSRIQALFRTLGYPEAVADSLGGICTTATPRAIWKAADWDVNPTYVREARALHARPHLPQGAPTSPALANISFYRADCRLAGLAAAAGAAYTRYADDLVFSGGEAFARGVERFSTHVAAILIEEGFHVQHRKTRIMRQAVRQHLAGLVVNHHQNVIRADFDRLKATLTNCVRHGPEGQNRAAHPCFREHLSGRVGFVEMIHPAKGKRLRAIYEQIRWE